MKGDFVSDISDVLLDYYDNKEFEKIQNAIGDEITNLTGSDKYDSAYRLQQDIAFLNTNLLTSISKYINTNAHDTNEEEKNNNTQTDTFKAQTKSSKINLSYKYFYLLIKLITIIVLLGAIYFYFFSSSISNYDKKLPYNSL